MSERGILAAIIAGSLRHSFAVLGLVSILGLLALGRLRDTNFDVFPDFAPPQAAIQTEAPGLSPEQVEMLVTHPIEMAISGVPGLVSVRSNSIQGLSAIVVIFRADVDIFRVRQQLTEALGGLSQQLPGGIGEPRLAPLTSSTGVVVVAGLTSRVVSPIELRTAADWLVRPRLQAVPGVAKINVYGGASKQYRIGVDPERLAAFGLSFDEVATAARNALGVRGAGFIDTSNQRIVLEAGDGRDGLARLRTAIVASRDGRRLTLEEVATLSEGEEPLIGAALIDGHPGIQLVVSAQYGANTVKIAAAVDRELAELKRTLATRGIEVRDDIFRPASFIRTALGNLADALAIGGVLVVIVVMIFLWNIRMALVALTAIPLSLLAATVIMESLGYSLNTMTLGGLGISVGLLVDDAVIVVENVYRRLRETAGQAAYPSVIETVAAATYEVRSAVVFATLAIALVFVPVLSIDDVAGRLFGPLGVAYVLATLASMVVAITVTPILCSVLLRTHAFRADEPVAARWLKTRYTSILRWVDQRFAFVAALTSGICLAILSLALTMGASFIPALKEGHYVALMSLAPGSSLSQSLAAGEKVVEALKKVPDVRLAAQRAGRAEQADDIFGTHYSEIDIDLKPTDAAGQTAAEAGIRAALQTISGATFSLRPFLSDRLDEVVSGYTAPVIVRLSGTDLDQLDAAATQVAVALTAIPHAIDVRLQNPTGVPKLSVELREAELMRRGFNSMEVLDAVHTAYQGLEVGQVYEQERVFGTTLMLADELRARPETVLKLLLRAPDGSLARLDELAAIRVGAGRYGVLHEGAGRIQVVTAGTSLSDIRAFTTRARDVIHAMKLPAGVRATVTGAADAQAQAMAQLTFDAGLAVTGMLLLLSLTIRSKRNLVLIIANLPFALVGGVLALALTVGIASIGALVGFVTLFGISLRNAVMLIAHYEHLTMVEGCAWDTATMIRGAQERLVPILMTTLATALGLLPLALGSGEAGRELEGPMAIVILGGLLSSAVLNLFIVPSLALRWGDPRPAPALAKPFLQP